MAALLASCSDPTVAVVNGEKISRTELNDILLKKAGRQVLDQLINEKLVLREAKRNKILITEKAIDGRIKKLKSRFPDEKSWQKNLDENRMTGADVRRQVEIMLATEKILKIKKTLTAESLVEHLRKTAKIETNL